GGTVPTKITISTTSSTGTFANRLTIDENGFQPTNGIIAPGFAPASLPSGTSGQIVQLSSGGASKSLAVFDGTQWQCDVAKGLKLTVFTCPPYNATGDGTTDDTSALQSAVNGTGRDIICPNGTFIVSADITLQNNTRLYLAPGCTMKLKSGT